MPRYWTPLPGDPIAAATFSTAFDEVEELTTAVIGDGIVSGVLVGSISSRTVVITPGSVVFSGGQFSFPGGQFIAAANTTTHIYLVSVYDSPSRTYSAALQTNTTGVAPGSSLKIGTVTANANSITVQSLTTAGGRAQSLISVSALSGYVNNIQSTGYFPIAATGQLINYINNQAVSGAYVTTAAFQSASGTFASKDFVNTLLVPVAQASGGWALQSSVTTSLNVLSDRISQVTNATGSYASTSALQAVDNKFSAYIPRTESGLYASSASVRALMAATGSYLTSLGTGYATSGQIAALTAATGTLLPIASRFSLNGATGNVLLESSGSIQITRISSGGGEKLNIYSPITLPEVGGVTSLNLATGSIIIAGSGSLVVDRIGNVIYLYAPSGSVSSSETDPYFREASGSFLTLAQYAASSGSGGVENDPYFISSSGQINTRLINLETATGSYLPKSSSGQFLTLSQYASSSGSIIESDPYYRAASGQINSRLSVLEIATGSYLLKSSSGQFVSQGQYAASSGSAGIEIDPYFRAASGSFLLKAEYIAATSGFAGTKAELTTPSTIPTSSMANQGRLYVQTISGQSYDNYILSDTGLKYYWKFNETTGTSLVDSVSAYNVALATPYTLGTAGLTNDGSTSVLFNGGGASSVSTRSANWTADVSGSVSFEFWFTWDGTAGFTGLFRLDNVLNINILDGNLRYLLKGSTADALVSALVANRLYHYVATLDYSIPSGTVVRAYINGAQQTTQTFNNSAWTYAVNDFRLPNPWSGRVGKVAFYSRALTSLQVLDHYNKGLEAVAFSDDLRFGARKIDGSYVNATVYTDLSTTVPPPVVVQLQSVSGALNTRVSFLESLSGTYLTKTQYISSSGAFNTRLLALEASGSYSGSGSAGSGSVYPSRTKTLLTTSSLANASSATGTVALGKAFALYQVSGSVYSRIRLYPTQLSMASDINRAFTTAPSPGKGLITDIDLDASFGLLCLVSPINEGANLDEPPIASVYYVITNNSGATGTVTIAFTSQVREI